MKLQLHGVTATAAIAAAALVGMSGPAQASTPIYQWHNDGTDACLDSNAHGNVYTLLCNGGAYQRWSQWSNSGSYLLKDTETGMFLCEEQDHQLATLCGAGSQALNWAFIWQPGGYYQIKSVGGVNPGTGDCLSDENGQLQPGPCNTEPWTLWWHTS